MKHKTLALPIRRVDYSDTSQVVSLFTRDHGLIEGIAKGAYRPRNAFQGPFDLATLSEVVYIRRGRGTALAIITEATHLDGFRGLRRCLDRHVAAGYVLEFLRAVATPEAPVLGLFEAAVGSLAAIGGASGPDELADILAFFEARAFRVLGLSAEIRSCGECGRPWLREDRPVFFCPEIGGVICPRCRSGKPALKGRFVPGRVIRRLNELGSAAPGGNGERHPGWTAAGGAGVRRELRALLGGLRVFLLERDFRMLQYISFF